MYIGHSHNISDTIITTTVMCIDQISEIVAWRKSQGFWHNTPSSMTSTRQMVHAGCLDEYHLRCCTVEMAALEDRFWACFVVVGHIQKDSWSLDDQNPLQKWLTFLIFHWSEASDLVRQEPLLWNCGISDEFHFFRQKEITLCGKKHTAFFQTYDWEKSSFFPGPNRVQPNFCVT